MCRWCNEWIERSPDRPGGLVAKWRDVSGATVCAYLNHWHEPRVITLTEALAMIS